MKYSYTWLKELSGTKKTGDMLAEILTLRAFELEGMKKEGGETQLEFDILPNRGHDALSYIGMAREICAVEGKRYRESASLRLNPKAGLKVEIKDKKLCPRYMGAVLENMKVAPSPKWMQARLLVSGIKPINNIVDITNYVMLETGQPLHAFDKLKTTGNIIVRRAKKGEKIKLLDEKACELNESALVIADSSKPIALAGVMGGFDSSVTNKTTSIILESANFNSTNIRKTRTARNIITESSYRFERDIDPNLVEIGMAKAIGLIQKICGKNIKVTAITDIYPKKTKPWQVKLNTDYVNRLLGEKIPVPQMKKILDNLGIDAKAAKNILNCEIPTRRIDLKTQEDLIEEIGRIYGYENIREQTPFFEVATPPQNEKREFENKLRDILTGLGFSEVMNYSFYSKDDIRKCNLKAEGHYEVANPMNPDQKYLRSSLIPGILKNVSLNLKNFDKFSIFEIGHKFRNESRNIPTEKTVLAGVFVDTAKKETTFFELKSKIETLLKNAGHANYKFDAAKQEKFWHPTRSAEISIGGKKIGRLGEINPKVLAEYGIKSKISVFRISIDSLLETRFPKKAYSSISKFPVAQRDISMFVRGKVLYADIEKKIYGVGGKLVLGIELFDVFEKEGEKSLALRLKIGSDSKTLFSREIDALIKKIISGLERELKVKVRK